MISGLYRATVINNADPLRQFRLQILIPEFSDQPLKAWALACWPANVPANFYPPLPPPYPGQVVWVGFEKGDRDSPVWLGILGASI